MPKLPAPFLSRAQLKIWILLALAYISENFFSLLGMVAITVGVSLISHAAGWITAGLLMLLAAELPPVLRARAARSERGE